MPARLNRAYALLHVKALDPEARVLSGIASTPTADRKGDILEPAGATFTNPLPLLLHHDGERPIGRARLTHTPEGLAFEAALPVIDEPGPLRDRVNEAWQSVKAGLIRGVSIGFRPLGKHGVKYLKDSGGLHFLNTEILELSLVTIPANVDATILSIKSLDAPYLAALGPHLPGAAGVSLTVRAKGAPPMTTTEHISALEASRAAKTGRMTNLMQTAADGSTTLDAAQSAEYDGLAAEVKSIDDDLVRFNELQRLNVAGALPVPRTPAAPAPVVRVKSNVPLGTAFIRAACAKLVCNGNVHEAAEYAKRWKDSTPEVELYLKAAIAPGTTTDPAWAGPLVNQEIAKDFLELLRPATILGKIPNLRTVPFNCKVPSQTAGGTYGWVGESKPKPVTKLAFAAETLAIAKAAGIIVLTEELVRLSNPSAEDLVRKDMIAGIAQFLDAQFIDPAVAAVAGVNPASITNGAATAAATANPFADIIGLISHFVTNNIAVDGVTFILSAANALSLAFRTNLDGSPQFPGLSINGGTYKGLTFITSQAAGGNVIALQPQLVLYADEGGVTIDASREASLQMDSAPMSPADATTVYVSLWQANCVGLRAERYVNWKRVGASVKYLTATAWPAPSSAAPPAGLD